MRYLRHLPLLFLCAFCAKLLLLPEFSINYAAIVAILAALSGFIELKAENHDITLLKSKLDDHDKALIAALKMQDDIKTQLSSVKLAQNLRSTKI